MAISPVNICQNAISVCVNVKPVLSGGTSVGLPDIIFSKQYVLWRISEASSVDSCGSSCQLDLVSITGSCCETVNPCANHPLLWRLRSNTIRKRVLLVWLSMYRHMISRVEFHACLIAYGCSVLPSTKDIAACLLQYSLCFEGRCETDRVYDPYVSTVVHNQVGEKQANWKQTSRCGGQRYTFSQAELAAFVIPNFENRMSDVDGGAYTFVDHIISPEGSLTQESHVGLVPVTMSLHALSCKLNMADMLKAVRVHSTLR